jgi:hypothetical protein
MTTTEFCKLTGLTPRKVTAWIMAGLLQTELVDKPHGGFRRKLGQEHVERVRILQALHFNESVYAPIAAGAELPGVRFHDLRHFFASVLIAQGKTAKYVQDQMGHSSIQVTFDTYGHLFPQARQESVSRLDATLTAALSNKNLGSIPNDLLEGKEPKRRAENELLETLLETDAP